MSMLKATDPLALSLLLTDDIYLIKDEKMPLASAPVLKEENLAGEIQQEHFNFNYLGENNRYILLLVKEPEHEVIDPKDLESLNAILKAKNMELRDVAVVNLDKYPGVRYEDLKSFFAPAKAVLFGINPESTGLPALATNAITDYSGARILVTFSFAEMQNDIDRKRVFWNEMKRL